jgi:hypothetical protein
VNDSLSVNARDDLGELERHLEKSIHGKRLSSQPLLQVPRPNVFEHEGGLGFVESHRPDDVGHVRRAQGHQHLELVMEPRGRIAVSRPGANSLPHTRAARRVGHPEQDMAPASMNLDGRAIATLLHWLHVGLRSEPLVRSPPPRGPLRRSFEQFRPTIQAVLREGGTATRAFSTCQAAGRIVHAGARARRLVATLGRVRLRMVVARSRASDFTIRVLR